MRKCGAVFFGVSARHHEKGYVFGVRDEWLTGTWGHPEFNLLLPGLSKGNDSYVGSMLIYGDNSSLYAG